MNSWIDEWIDRWIDGWMNDTQIIWRFNYIILSPTSFIGSPSYPKSYIIAQWPMEKTIPDFWR